MCFRFPEVQVRTRKLSRFQDLVSWLSRLSCVFLRVRDLIITSNTIFPVSMRSFTPIREAILKAPASLVVPIVFAVYQP
jgi:hypothetical protein